MPILTLTETRNLLRKIGHRPKKKLGQNFLIDGNIVKKSLRLAEIRRNDIVIEVGPGLGTLTSALLEAGATVFAVEYDPTLARYLKNTLKPAFLDQLNLRLDDAVKCPLGEFHWDRSSNSDPSFKVVANLPYAITTPWLDSLLSGPLPDQMVLLLQKEAAERIVASTGTRKFSAISILFQSAFERISSHKIAPQCFFPKPAVESVLLKFVKREKPHIFTQPSRSALRTIFSQRRKQIRSICWSRPNLKPWLQLLIQNGISPRARPEDIPLTLWQDLDNLPPFGREGTR